MGQHRKEVIWKMYVPLLHNLALTYDFMINKKNPAFACIDSILGMNKNGTLRHSAVPIAQANQYRQLMLPSRSVIA
jgi:hypothetical protein